MFIKRGYNVVVTVNHSLAFDVSYNIARNAFQDDTSAGKNSVQCRNNLREKHFMIPDFNIIIRA